MGRLTGPARRRRRAQGVRRTRALLGAAAATAVAGSACAGASTSSSGEGDADARANAGRSAERAPPPRLARGAPPSAGPLLVRAVDPRAPTADGALYEISADGVRRAGRPKCARVHASPGGPALCVRVSANGYDYEAVVLDGAYRPRARLPVDGVPSRVRVSRDGRYGALTTFEGRGQGYFADTSDFSTATRIVDMRSGRPLLRLEDLLLRRDGRWAPASGGDLWGVTFGERGRFYATYATGPDHLLIEGRVGSRRARVVGRHVECPSLSPDGTRIAYKRRIGATDSWRLHVRELANGRDWALAETRSIDDQPEWLGDGWIAYSHAGAVYAARADGSGSPALLAASAASPAALAR